MKKEIDGEYLVEIVKQIRCKNNGIKSHVNKKAFLGQTGFMLGDEHFSFDYVREKTNVIDALLDTICRDILLKSGRFRKLPN